MHELLACARGLKKQMMPHFGYKEWSPKEAGEFGAFLDALVFLRVIMSFCLSPSTSAN